MKSLPLLFQFKMIEISQGQVCMFKCCCEGRKVRYGSGKDLADNQYKQGYINQDDIFVNDKTRRHPFLIITQTSNININGYVTVIPITSKGNSFYNIKNSIQITGDMVKKDNANITNNSYLKVDMPTRILVSNLDSQSSDCDQATFYGGKPFNEILNKVVEKHLFIV